MKVKIRNIVFLSILIALTGCPISRKWTEEERETFKKKCENQIYFDPDPICFTGFLFEEIDTVTVIEKDSSTNLDTLFIYPAQKRSKYDEQQQKYWGSADVQFNVNHTYEFYLGTDTPYVLDNMEMIMWANLQ
ncbi:hypothetical protein ABWH96_10585 [Marivirga tractuosa]|uniref:hypothetical protein n=1 Tax=Marivirga tractuosa TaxID=1006 RepID=UPI0035CF34AD